MNSNYYVYLYLRENGTPYYCGKGKGKRAYRKGSPDAVKLVAIHLSESEAFTLEKRLIKLYGRKDLGTGILNNRTDGGEGSSGATRSKEARLRISNAKKGVIPSEEHRKNLSKARKGKPHTEAHCIALRKPRSEEAKLNMSRGCMGRKISDETRAKISATLKARAKSKTS